MHCGLAPPDVVSESSHVDLERSAREGFGISLSFVGLNRPVLPKASALCHAVDPKHEQTQKANEEGITKCDNRFRKHEVKWESSVKNLRQRSDMEGPEDSLGKLLHRPPQGLQSYPQLRLLNFELAVAYLRF